LDACSGIALLSPRNITKTITVLRFARTNSLARFQPISAHAENRDQKDKGHKVKDKSQGEGVNADNRTKAAQQRQSAAPERQPRSRSGEMEAVVIPAGCADGTPCESAMVPWVFDARADEFGTEVSAECAFFFAFAGSELLSFSCGVL
jgi:hypothetical protein